MIGTRTAGKTPLVLVGSDAGMTLIPPHTPLTRLNYFDGKYLRADDLQREQDYLRALVHISNQAGGAGVVHGFDTRLGSGGTLEVGPGLAIDRAGRVLLAPNGRSVGLMELIERSRRRPSGDARDGADGPSGRDGFTRCEADAAAPATPTTTFPTSLYLIVAAHGEARCGEEDVYGKLCEDACITESNYRFRLEGVTLLAVPFSLGSPTCTGPDLSDRHLRSQVASAYFATERARLGRRISADRLRTGPWCLGARVEHWPAEAGEGVPLGVVSVTGGTVHWLDAWMARRERMEAPARKYWAWQMMMRPWEVFLAQLLQFQCHLRDVLAEGPSTGPGEDPCGRPVALLERARGILERIERRYAEGGAVEPVEVDAPVLVDAITHRPEAIALPRPEYLVDISHLRKEILVALDEAEKPGPAQLLIDGGIVELPPAGYLPVVPGREVEAQVRKLMGERVDLRFCAVRPDYVAHALEEAQHMERICLLGGGPEPEVDVLVPDGEVVEREAAPRGTLFEVTVRRAATQETSPNDPTGAAGGTHLEDATPFLRGAGRGQRLASGGGAFHFAGIGGPMSSASAGEMFGLDDEVRRVRGLPGGERARAPRVSDFMRWIFRARTGADLSAVQPEFPGMAEASTRARAFVRQQYTLAVWATLRCEENPFDLQVGDAARVSAEVAAALDGPASGSETGTRAVEVRVTGSLVCREPAGGGQRMRGVLRGWTHRRVVGEEEQDTPEAFSQQVELELRPLPGGATALVVRIQVEKSSSLTVTTAWEGRPVLAKSVVAEVSTGIEGGTSREVHMWAGFRESAEVAQPTNGYHADAVRGLRLVEKGLQDPGFRDSAERLLFPPPPPEQAGKVVRARHDWVLFHRRRTSSCDCLPCVAPAVPARLYRLYHLEVDLGVPVGRIRDMLLGTAPVGGAELVPVRPEFREGSATLANRREDVLEAWRSVATGNSLVYGAIAGAGAGAGDADALLEARLDRLVSVVDDETPAPSVEFDVLGRVPAGLSAEESDGVVVLVTQTVPVEVEETCHDVLWSSPEMWNRYEVSVQQGDLATAMQILAQLAQRAVLGTVTFRKGATEILHDSAGPVVAGWHATNEELERAVSLAWPEADDPMLLEQAQELAGLIRPDAGATEQAVPTSIQRPSPLQCPGTVVLITARREVERVCNDVYRLRRRDSLDALLRFLRQGRLAQNILEFADPIGTVEHDAGTGDILDDGDARLRDGWRARGNGTVTGAVATARENDGGPYEQRAREAVVAVGGSGTVQVRFIQNPGEMPGNCPGVTILVPDS